MAPFNASIWALIDDKELKYALTTFEKGRTFFLKQIIAVDGLNQGHNGPTARRHHQWRARYGDTRPTGATELTPTEWSGGRRAVSFGPTAYRRGEGSINANPWIVLSGSPVEQLLDAKTNVSPMSRRRDARRSLRADRPRGESGGDGQAAA